MADASAPALGISPAESAVTQELEEVGDLPRPQQSADQQAESGGDAQDDQDPDSWAQDMIVPSAHLV